MFISRKVGSCCSHLHPCFLNHLISEHFKNTGYSCRDTVVPFCNNPECGFIFLSQMKVTENFVSCSNCNSHVCKTKNGTG